MMVQTLHYPRSWVCTLLWTAARRARELYKSHFDKIERGLTAVFAEGAELQGTSPHGLG